MDSTPSTPRSPSERAEKSLTTTLKEFAGRTLDNRYLLVRVLGRGGMGSVFLAKHVVIGKPLAVKILDAHRINEKREYGRLFREAQTAAAIGHPNIIDVLDVGVAPEGHPYLVMEYLDGEDVASILRRQPAISLAVACAIMEPVLLALQAAHARQIVHRDVKPANIFVVRRKDSPPTVKLIDFGIAKELGPSTRAQLTLPGALLGTPSYMPPEQATGVEDVDTRADIYGVGITLYEMLSNRLPFEGANYNETLYKIVTDEPPPLKSPIEELPAEAVEIVEKAMHKDPDERFASAADMLAALQALPAWSERAAAFDALTKELRVHDVVPAIETTQVSPESPLAPRRQTPAAKLPTDFVETVADGASLQPRDSITRAGTPWLLRVASIASLAALVMFVFWLRNSEAPPTASPAGASGTAPSKPPAARAKITIVGAPAGASVTYDGVLIPENPFEVESTNTVMPIRVTSPGYETFVATVVPTRDTTVRVSMHERDAAPTAAPVSSATGKSPTPASLKQSPQRKTTAPGEVQKSGRGTFFTEKFE